MNLLLDTHVLIWWLLDKERLSKAARSHIGDRQRRLSVSVVSAYEIEYKRDKDSSLYRFPTNMVEAIPLFGFEWLEIEAADSVRAARFDLTHKDPWDRIIAAQASRRDLLLLTSDEALTQACRTWNVSTVW